MYNLFMIFRENEGANSDVDISSECISHTEIDTIVDYLLNLEDEEITDGSEIKLLPTYRKIIKRGSVTAATKII